MPLIPDKVDVDMKLPREVIDLAKTLKQAVVEAPVAKLAWLDGARTGGVAVAITLILVYVLFLWKGGRS